MLREDKIAIWSKLVMDLKPEPDTVQLLIYKLDEYRQTKRIILSVDFLANLHPRDRNENYKLYTMLREFSDLDIHPHDVHIMIKRLESYKKTCSIVNDDNANYRNDFENIIDSLNIGG